MENVEQRYDIAVETARDAIEELRLAAYAKGYEDARRELMAQAPAEKTAQERRDEIVEQAKADVSGLLKRDIGHDHEFIVNTEKRTVVVLRKLRGCTNIVRRRNRQGRTGRLLQRTYRRSHRSPSRTWTRSA
ncbi:hypothetical protein [Bacillus licheniformis]|uniref:hypothetical protein n=1 Tax=Bacillus licheniformis TaxID=1402 RepID=UPI0009C34184|nr:hypothetical protein [Bacillus licheniformis]ARC72394.1 hypothetical protein B37_00339 [Bacillus licheniformis]ARW41530.1 hypothetical protein S100141_00205 [Bacillus licheniformis]ARW46023.1 hypothetical protein S100141_04803 [Bacillus licheniformis]ARW53004.1 hypothetical protein S100027_01005 [Bacillus licheniformis]